ncbi:MAG: VIT1/CCC1 transporter family protein [Candidatus Curtissbacteria bacterium]|nr:VIT1/CCC1 transporter family protein [Candidatus Curtissbacteria bacterium]
MAASSIADREPGHPNSGNFLRDIVFGANDGVVTAIGFLVGIAGTVNNQGIIVLAGILTIVAGSASMALGNYLGVKSQREFYDQMERIERWEMEHKPDVEKQEIEEIYSKIGFSGRELEILVDKVTSDKELWLSVMMRDELGLSQEENGNPVVSGLIMGAFYLLGGIPPLLPFIFLKPINRALIFSVIVAVLVMGFIGFFRWFLNKGSLKGKVMETIIIGILAAFVGFAAGQVLTVLGVQGVSI